MLLVLYIPYENVIRCILMVVVLVTIVVSMGRISISGWCYIRSGPGNIAVTITSGPVGRVTVVAISWLSLSLPLVEVVASGLVTGLVRAGISWMALVDVVSIGV